MSDTSAPAETPKTEPFEIRSRWIGAVQFTAQIAINIPTIGLKIGAAIRWALTNSADLRGAVLTHADLRGADLRGADLRGAGLTGADLRGAVLTHADLRGADLTHADLRGAVLTHAVLTHAALTHADLTHAVAGGADLTHADLRGAGLTGADLRGAVLTHADLRGADLRGAVLTHAVLTGAPVVPNIDAAIVAAINAGGNLKMDSWHTCGTTHCRAGWAIHLAGEAGYKLEAEIGPAAAGALIYAASRPGERVPNFYATDADAMDDLRAAAAKSSGEGIVA